MVLRIQEKESSYRQKESHMLNRYVERETKMSDLHGIDETEGKELNIVIVAMVQKLEEGREEGPCLQVQGLRL